MDKTIVRELRKKLGESRYIANNQKMEELFERLPDFIDYPVTINIASNSVFFFEELNWNNQDENSLEYKLKTFINALAKEGTNREIMSQSWRLFSVITYLLFQGRRVQATSLMDSCYRLSIINYASDGVLENCQLGLNLLWQEPGQGKNDTSIENYYYELSSKLKCSDCIERDKEHTFKFPCYHILEKTDKTIFSHFLRSWFLLSVDSKWRGKDLRAIRDKFFRKGKQPTEWKGIIDKGRKNETYYLVDNYPVYDGRSYFFDNRFRASITDIRNVLAHGNFKEPEDIIYNDNLKLIDERICNSYFLLLDFLLFLTKDAFVKNREKIVTGKHLFLAFHELDNYEDEGVSIFQDLSILRTYCFAKHQQCQKKPLVKDNDMGRAVDNGIKQPLGGGLNQPAANTDPQ